MLHQILQAAGMRSWLGGNFGGSLLAEAGRYASRTTAVVLELSSFQLHWLSPEMQMPQLAVVTNCQPNHLDWHPTLEHYRQAKQRLLARQRPGDTYVLGHVLADDPAWQGPWPGEPLQPGRRPRSANSKLPVAISVQNAALAAAAAASAGCDRPAIAAGLAAFRGLPHRLQTVGWLGSRHWIDDSKATTPASTLAAIDTIDSPAWWLIGGADKGSDFAPLVDRLNERAKGVAFYGATGDRLFRLAKERGPQLNCALCQTLGEARPVVLAVERGRRRDRALAGLLEP